MRFAPLLGATAALRAPPRLPRRLPCRASSGASVDAAAAPNKLDGVLPLAYGAASAALVAKSFQLRRAPPEAAEGPVATRTRAGRGRTSSELGNSVGFGPGVHLGNNPYPKS